MSKSALLINPWIYDFSAYDYWMKPLGLLYMASYLRENGLHVRFIDCLNPLSPEAPPDAALKIPKRKPGGHGKLPKEEVAKPETLEDIPKKYHRYGMKRSSFEDIIQHCVKPDIVLVTAMMTYWYPGVFEVIRIVKNLYPDVPVILGGNYATLCPEHALKSQADYVLTGDGESHIPSLLNDLLDMPLLFKPDLHQLDKLPYPAFDLLVKPDQLPIMTSRGCPFRCPYCASHKLYQGFMR
ncbi:MAG: cobalamin-dependent protein, partial [Syntrophales bacterium]|nr:cobalamin-dependent protein [Syntrophales bacterium]